MIAVKYLILVENISRQFLDSRITRHKTTILRARQDDASTTWNIHLFDVRSVEALFLQICQRGCP